MTETSPHSVDILVVTPSQQDTLIMANAGGQNTVRSVTLKFDDAAATNLTQLGQIVTGTNQPSGFLPVQTFP